MKTEREIVLFGVSYRTCPLEVRERLALSSSAMEGAYRDLAGLASETIILSTCHRLEVYAVPHDSGDGPNELASVIAHWSGLPLAELLKYSVACRGEEALRHLFSVSAGLDSVVLGEFQILGQVSGAAKQAHALGAAGHRLSSLFYRAVAAGRRVRSETPLGRRDASLSYGAVALAQRMLGGLKSKKALVIGAGKVGELAAFALREHGVACVDVVSRSASTAQRLAEQVGGRSIPFDDLDEALASCDVAVSCTSAPHAVVRYPVVQRAVSKRTSPLVLIDLALPRDIEPEVSQIAGVCLKNVDDIDRPHSNDALSMEQYICKAWAIVDEELGQFMTWLRERDVVPLLASLYRRAEDIRLSELARAQTRLSGLAPDEKRALDAMTKAMVKKLLHQPVSQLKEAARSGDGVVYREAVQSLFKLSVLGETDG